MAKEDAKQAYALVSLYIALYKTRYGKPPMVNRYREKWAMQDVIDTLDFSRAKEILEYYIKELEVIDIIDEIDDCGFSINGFNPYNKPHKFWFRTPAL